MAALTEFTNLAEVSVSETGKQNSTRSTKPCEDSLSDSTADSSSGKGYIKVSKNYIPYSNGDPAASNKNTSDIQGPTISFHNLRYSAETKIKRKKVTKMIVKGIRYFVLGKFEIFL